MDEYCFSDESLTCKFQRLNQIINELEALKPEVRDQIEHMEFAHQNAGFAVQNSANSRISRSTSVRNQYYYNTDMHKVWPRFISSRYLVAICCFPQPVSILFNILQICLSIVVNACYYIMFSSFISSLMVTQRFWKATHREVKFHIRMKVS